jgi:hypothetical protein
MQNHCSLEESNIQVVHHISPVMKPVNTIHRPSEKWFEQVDVIEAALSPYGGKISPSLNKRDQMERVMVGLQMKDPAIKELRTWKIVI